jgi:hypothetical protein
MSRHVLVPPCSATKSASQIPMPAFQRYRGPLRLQLAVSLQDPDGIDPPDARASDGLPRCARREEGRLMMNQPTLVLPAGVSRHTIVALTELTGERARQVSEEGFAPEWDDRHRPGDIALAAAAYAAFAALPDENAREHHRQSLWGFVPGSSGIIGQLWPWPAQWFKPRDRRRELMKAGALILAQLERLSREAERARPSGRRADDPQSPARSHSPAVLLAPAAEGAASGAASAGSPSAGGRMSWLAERIDQATASYTPGAGSPRWSSRLRCCSGSPGAFASCCGRG